jgi:glucose-1-phosphate adenylyltransferase
MDNVLAVILGGGQGKRLYPLTKMRAKPAIPLAGKYRLIDIPVSNCINSDIMRIFVLTQFNSASLNQHITNTYRFSPFSRGFVEVIAAQQTPDSPDWFQGTADAVRKSLYHLRDWNPDEYLILSGDHLYRMDYRLFLDHHRTTGADVTLAVIPVSERQANGFGILKTDANGRITDFKEKPDGEALHSMKAFSAKQDTPYMGSMGIYVFEASVLENLLKQHRNMDFGMDVIPQAIKEYNVHAYVFHGYWEDIGTIEAFYRANLELVKQPAPRFSFYDDEFSIFTRPRFLPPSKMLDCKIVESMICDGCILKTATVRNSIIGIRSRLDENVVVENSLLMGADYYQSPEERLADERAGLPCIGIGANSVIRSAIIDKNARLGRSVQIINHTGAQNLERESEGYWIRSGIVTIFKGAVIPDGKVI